MTRVPTGYNDGPRPCDIGLWSECVEKQSSARKTLLSVNVESYTAIVKFFMNISSAPDPGLLLVRIDHRGPSFVRLPELPDLLHSLDRGRQRLVSEPSVPGFCFSKPIQLKNDLVKSHRIPFQFNIIDAIPIRRIALDIPVRKKAGRKISRLVSFRSLVLELEGIAKLHIVSWFEVLRFYSALRLRPALMSV
jgi:hypothetical protein